METQTLQEQFKKTLVNDLQKKLMVKNIMAVPHMQKIVINMGVKDAVADKKNIEKMAVVLGQIAGQKPRVARSKKSIASFKVREGDPIGLVITLRGKRMYAFIDKIVKVVLPRIKDFHGISKNSFDIQGNYTLGLREYAVFPEIDISTVERMQGMEIVFVNTATNKEQGLELLTILGMPFTKEAKKKN